MCFLENFVHPGGGQTIPRTVKVDLGVMSVRSY